MQDYFSEYTHNYYDIDVDIIIGPPRSGKSFISRAIDEITGIDRRNNNSVSEILISLSQPEYIVSDKKIKKLISLDRVPRRVYDKILKQIEGKKYTVYYIPLTVSEQKEKIEWLLRNGYDISWLGITYVIPSLIKFVDYPNLILELEEKDYPINYHGLIAIKEQIHLLHNFIKAFGFDKGWIAEEIIYWKTPSWIINLDTNLNENLNDLFKGLLSLFLLKNDGPKDFDYLYNLIKNWKYLIEDFKYYISARIALAFDLGYEDVYEGLNKISEANLDWEKIRRMHIKFLKDFYKGKEYLIKQMIKGEVLASALHNITKINEVKPEVIFCFKVNKYGWVEPICKEVKEIVSKKDKTTLNLSYYYDEVMRQIKLGRDVNPVFALPLLNYIVYNDDYDSFIYYLKYLSKLNSKWIDYYNNYIILALKYASNTGFGLQYKDIIRDLIHKLKEPYTHHLCKFIDNFVLDNVITLEEKNSVCGDYLANKEEIVKNEDLLNKGDIITDIDKKIFILDKEANPSSSKWKLLLRNLIKAFLEEPINKERIYVTLPILAKYWWAIERFYPLDAEDIKENVTKIVFNEIKEINNEFLLKDIMSIIISNPSFEKILGNNKKEIIDLISQKTNNINIKNTRVKLSYIFKRKRFTKLIKSLKTKNKEKKIEKLVKYLNDKNLFMFFISYYLKLGSGKLFLGCNVIKILLKSEKIGELKFRKRLLKELVTSPCIELILLNTKDREKEIIIKKIKKYVTPALVKKYLKYKDPYIRALAWRNIREFLLLKIIDEKTLRKLLPYISEIENINEDLNKLIEKDKIEEFVSSLINEKIS